MVLAARAPLKFTSTFRPDHHALAMFAGHADYIRRGDFAFAVSLKGVVMRYFRLKLIEPVPARIAAPAEQKWLSRFLHSSAPMVMTFDHPPAECRS